MRKRRHEKKPENKRNLRELVSRSLSVPEDVLFDLPRITLCGNRELEVENYKNVLEYLENSIQLNCRDCVLRLTGRNLEIVSITDESVSIRGSISGVSFTG